MMSGPKNEKPEQSLQLKPGARFGEWILQYAKEKKPHRQVWHCKSLDGKREKNLLFESESDLDELTQKLVIETESIPANVLYQGLIVDGWQLVQNLGTGSNGEVWQCRHHQTGQQAALKICLSKKANKIEWFRNEVIFLTTHQQVPGVIPLLAFSLAKHDIKQQRFYWLAMPEGQPISEYLQANQHGWMAIIAFLSYADSIGSLLTKGYLYGDIKHSNMLVVNNQFYLIDFNTMSDDPPDQLHKKFLNIKRIHLRKLLVAFFEFTNTDQAQQTALLSLYDQHNWDQMLSKFAYWLVEHVPESSINWVVSILLTRHYFAQARALLNKTPDSAQKCYWLGLMARQQGRLPEAQQYFQQAVQQQGQIPYVTSLVEVLAEQNQLEKAFSWLRLAVQKVPRNHSLHELHGRLQQQQRLNQLAKSLKPQVNADLDKAWLAEGASILQKSYPLISAQDNRLLYAGELESEQGQSYASISWDQYFHDLSVGAFRTAYDDHYRAYHPRTWHYVFKNIKLVEHIYIDPHERLHIADLGCSSGYLKRFLEGNYSKLESKKICYHGLDIRKDVLLRAVHAVNDIESGAVSNNIPATFIQHDLQYGLPYQSASMHFIISFELIKYFPIDLAQYFLQEVYRCLRQDGLFYVSSSFGGFKPGFVENLSRQAFADSLTSVGFKIERQAGSQLRPNELVAAMAPEHRKLFHQLLQHHAIDIVTAFFAPLYPAVASQVTWVCRKI